MVHVSLLYIFILFFFFILLLCTFRLFFLFYSIIMYLSSFFFFFFLSCISPLWKLIFPILFATNKCLHGYCELYATETLNKRISVRSEAKKSRRDLFYSRERILSLKTGNFESPRRWPVFNGTPCSAPRRLLEIKGAHSGTAGRSMVLD